MPSRVQSIVTIKETERTIDFNLELNEVINAIRGTRINSEGVEEIVYVDFEKIIPMPDDLSAYSDPYHEISNDRMWRTINWGTKNNTIDSEVEGNQISFWTAWAPAAPVICELSRQFPNVRFVVEFGSCEAGYFGSYEAVAGEIYYYKDEDYDCSQDLKAALNI